MKIAAFDPIVDEARVELQAYNSDNAWLSVKVETTSMEELLKTSDFITLHVPFSGGKPIIGREEFAKMKKAYSWSIPPEGVRSTRRHCLKRLNQGRSPARFGRV